ncbi:MAG: hypothetical protein KDD60_11920 [Bdellovibrionales bacterium]|nr:hypothetical protein [Bdellovibrionales bacterium]
MINSIHRIIVCWFSIAFVVLSNLTLGAEHIDPTIHVMIMGGRPITVTCHKSKIVARPFSHTEVLFEGDVPELYGLSRIEPCGDDRFIALTVDGRMLLCDVNSKQVAIFEAVGKKRVGVSSIGVTCNQLVFTYVQRAAEEDSADDEFQTCYCSSIIPSEISDFSVSVEKRIREKSWPLVRNERVIARCLFPLDGTITTAAHVPAIVNFLDTSSGRILHSIDLPVEFWYSWSCEMSSNLTLLVCSLDSDIAIIRTELDGTAGLRVLSRDVVKGKFCGAKLVHDGKWVLAIDREGVLHGIDTEDAQMKWKAGPFPETVAEELYQIRFSFASIGEKLYLGSNYGRKLEVSLPALDKCN